MDEAGFAKKTLKYQKINIAISIAILKFFCHKSAKHLPYCLC